MTLSYKTRRALKTVGIVLLSLILAFTLFYLVWLVWLDRYVVYTREGARLDFDAPADSLSGQVALPPEEGATVSIFYNDGENAVDTSNDLTQLYGYYITSSDLETSMAELRTKVEALPTGVSVMLDVKSIYGSFFYSSSVGSHSEDISISAVDDLIALMRSKNIYMIARVPAFQDWEFGLNNVSCGLPEEGGYLWQDPDSGCYWLDPAAAGTINHLAQIVSELKGLGFREVVFTDFRFPGDMSSIVYEGDQGEALNKAAQALVTNCANTTFAVSFQTIQGAITLPEGRTRQYLSGVSAMAVQNTVDALALAEPEARLVFLTETNDTRYDTYGVLRPITMLQLDAPDAGQ